ncbi:MAG: hypothetical protein Q9214_003642 [Letrouitia sp. 1 TL-2023]
MTTNIPNGNLSHEELENGEEVASTTVPPASDPSKKRNAFSELLSPPKKPSPSVLRSTPPAATFAGRAGLGAYIQAPETFPASRVITYDDKFVTINDLYPKSSIHLLLLPRNLQKQLLHPFEALSTDAEFLSEVKLEVEKLKVLAAKELRRRFGKYSTQESKREKARELLLEKDEDIDEALLPPGRDWEKEIVAGVHTHPSMAHLHIHIISVDRHSDCLRHRKHYNSFATPFLANLSDFPMSEEEMRRRRHERYLERDFVCWRCGRDFGNKFVKLKAHLVEEFEEWKTE